MKAIIQKTMGLLTITIALASCAKKDNMPNPEGTGECWYSITLDDEIASPNLFGQDNIHITSTYGIQDDEEEGGLFISISQTKADGEKKLAYAFGIELAEFNRETPMGTVFTADSAVDIFFAQSLIKPAWDVGPHYIKVEGNGDEGVPTLPTLTVVENSDQRIRFRVAGMVEKWEGDLDKDAKMVGLVNIGGEFIIGRSHYIETPMNGMYIAGVNCECKEK